MIASRIGVCFILGVLTLASGCGGTTEPTKLILVTVDTTRADRLGCYGYADAQTPAFDAFADDAMLFEQAVSPVPTTLPSHSSMLTGLYPQDHGVRYNLMFRLGPEARTLPEMLREQGFATAAFPASFILGGKYGLAQGFDVYKEPPSPDAGMRPADEGVDDALAWLSQRPEGGKSFVWLHFYDPHHPYTPPFPFSDKFRDRLYDGEIAFMDSEFGRLMEALRAEPDWDRTAVLVVGDHGEGLYDHGEKMHQNLIYESTQRVPFIIRAPGGSSGRVEEPVTLADITPTVLDLIGLPPGEELRGISLKPALEGDELPRRDIYLESLAGSLSYGWEELRGVRYGKWKLIDSEKAPELFDLENDPDELENLASIEGARLAELREGLSALIPPVGELEPEAVHDALDPEAQALLNSLGYTGGTGGSAEDAPLPRDLIHLESEMLRGQSAAFLKDFERLEDLALHILNADPTNKWGLSNLAGALMNTGRAREAQDYASELVRLYPDNEHSYSMFARTYNAQGLHEEALRVLETGLKQVEPQSETLSFLYLAASFDAENPDVCSVEVPQIVSGFPNSNNIMIMQARCEARGGDVETALATLERAVANGFRRMDVIEGAEDFAAVTATAEYAAIAERAAQERERAS